MTTSTLLSRLYPEPSPPSSLSNTTLMQMLHSMPVSPPTATTALNALYCSRHDPCLPYWPDPYLHRVCWVLINAEGQYLADINGTTMHFVHSANEVPLEHRFCTFERAKSAWVQLRQPLLLQDHSIAIKPVDFYAHRSAPTAWCACDD